MKILSTLIGALTLISASTLQAQDFEESAYLTGLLGYKFFDSDRAVDDAADASIGLGYEFTRNFASEIHFGGADLDAENGGSIDGRFLRLDALYHLTQGTTRPYLVGGGGSYEFDEDDETQWNAGAGVKHQISDALDLRADARAFHGSESSSTDAAVNVGVTFLFAGLVHRSQDDDGDGVFNDEDQCPNTPSTVQVDTSGCPAILDSDEDGVNDVIDQCPDTPAGTTVDSQGCPIPEDADGDGVADAEDACPDTPENLAVDAKGCPIQLLSTVRAGISVGFDSGSASISRIDLTSLGEFVALLEQYPNASGRIEGHSDSTGPEAFNQQLSQERAAAVRQYLIDNHGIAPERLTAEGFGESRPIADNNTAEGRAANRRVVGIIEAEVESLQNR